MYIVHIFYAYTHIYNIQTELDTDQFLPSRQPRESPSNEFYIYPIRDTFFLSSV
jgi:hypothetical protein